MQTIGDISLELRNLSFCRLFVCQCRMRILAKRSIFSERQMTAHFTGLEDNIKFFNILSDFLSATTNLRPQRKTLLLLLRVIRK